MAFNTLVFFVNGRKVSDIEMYIYIFTQQDTNLFEGTRTLSL